MIREFEMLWVKESKHYAKSEKNPYLKIHKKCEINLTRIPEYGKSDFCQATYPLVRIYKILPRKRIKLNYCKKLFFFLIHLFAQAILVMKKWDIEKIKPTFIASVLKVEH